MTEPLATTPTNLWKSTNWTSEKLPQSSTPSLQVQKKGGGARGKCAAVRPCAQLHDGHFVAASSRHVADMSSRACPRTHPAKKPSKMAVCVMSVELGRWCEARFLIKSTTLIRAAAMRAKPTPHTCIATSQKPAPHYRQKNTFSFLNRRIVQIIKCHTQ